MASDNQKDKKVFDVAKPGKTAANPSSRPVIIGHKNMLKDPMVKEQDTSELSENSDEKKVILPQEDKPSGGPSKPDETDSSEPTTAPTVTRINIQPLSEDEKTKPAKSTKIAITGSEQATDTKLESKKTKVPNESEDTPSTEDTLSPETNTEPVPDEEESSPTTQSASAKAEAGKTDISETETKSEDQASNSGSEAAAVDAVAGQAEAQKKNDKESQEAAAKTAAMEKLITEKKYFVPIGQKTRKKRSLRRVLLGIILILVLGILLADVMLDAGVIHYNNLEPPIKIINR